MREEGRKIQKSFALGIGLAMLGFVWLGSALEAPPEAKETNGGGPANKAAMAGSSIEILSAPLVEGAASEVHSILQTSIKTSSPTDLVLQLTTECALWTDVTTVGNDESEAVATVKLWVTVGGKTVAVSGDEDPAAEDFGKVVFCNRAYQRETSLFDDENATIETFLRTRSANAFNWITFDVGHGTHDIEVFAQLESQVNGVGMAQAGIGKRTLFVEPFKFANGATI